MHSPLTQEEIDRYEPDDDLRGPLEGHVERYSDGAGAIWWPPIVIMLGLFGWMVVAQILKVMR